jgi:hypothetical protein
MNDPAINLADLLPENFEALLESKGVNFIKTAGAENVRNIIVDVLCGQNLRASTEQLTRLRLGKISAATLMVYLLGWQSRNHQRQGFTFRTRDGDQSTDVSLGDMHYC